MPPSIVVLTGAGVSAESGLATFRDPAGIWSKVRIEDMATLEAFARNPARVHAFYNARRHQLTEPAIQPNEAHRALARLEGAWPAPFLLVTQNVDDLHARAGSRKLLPMHGALRRVRCASCGKTVAWEGDLEETVACAGCGSARLRPDIVWFGEIPYGLDEIETSLQGCDLFVSIGTSGSVYPAAGFVASVRGRARTVELNLQPSEGTPLFDEARHGPATEIVPRFVDELLQQWG